MLTIKVEKSGGDYSVIQEAIDAVPYDESAVIEIGAGVYKEKIFCEKKDITFVGSGMAETVIDYDDYANEVMPDGSKRGTFRTYTAFFGGKKVTVKDMTIRNSAGDGRVVGQAVAVYADADVCRFENVKMTGCQDTLFCAPLPVAARQQNGFMGPRMMTERRLTKQYYKNCEIVGDVDFIFGGADAVFDDCVITCNDRMFGRSSAGVSASSTTIASGASGSGVDKDQIDVSERIINGYVTAACGLKDNLGFVFRNCTITGASGCEKGSVFLGRPWREEARTVFLNCTMDDSIAPERFSGWGGITKDEPNTFYGEFGTRIATGIGAEGSNTASEAPNSGAEAGKPASLEHKNPWVRDIDESLATEITRRADELVQGVNGDGSL
ncbi:pectinesterase family protein [Butyrivibrio sp. VCB2001]|uniref:pectinesterase family protein n=1 Tax=Butyrivibrio sp. VCB2001 TaxID=1280667 RepID=UPI0003FEC7D0|nr:pectinesterase family protein [Butyrivibrio sp. VCB2001]